MTNQLLPNIDAKSVPLLNSTTPDAKLAVAGVKKVIVPPKPVEALKPNLLPPHIGAPETPAVTKATVPSAPGGLDLNKLKESAGFALTPSGLKPMKVESPVIKDVVKGKDTGLLNYLCQFFE